MKMKKKNYIPLILIIVFIVILVIVLTNIHKKDKFDYSMSQLKADPKRINVVKDFKFRFINQTDHIFYTDIKKRTKPNDEKNDILLLKDVYPSLSQSDFILVSNDSPTIQLIVSTRILNEDFIYDIINIDNPEFDYNITKYNPVLPCKALLSIPNKYLNIESDPRFIIYNEGDIRFEYKIKIINVNPKDNTITTTLLETKTYNNKCNIGEENVSNLFYVPNNSVVYITYRSCVFPGFERTVSSGILNKFQRGNFVQTARYSIFGPWYPNLIYKLSDD
jgi:hypothetical protein